MNDFPLDPQRPTPGTDPVAGHQDSPETAPFPAPTGQQGLGEESSGLPHQYPTTSAPDPTSQYPVGPYGDQNLGGQYPSDQYPSSQAGQQASAYPGDYSSQSLTQQLPGLGGQRPPWESAPPAPVPARRRRGLAAAAVLGVLLLGAGAGAGGAKLWTAANDDSSQTPSTTSSVVDNGKPVIAEGTEASVAAKVLPSVVKIEVSGNGGSGSGSGIILSSDGEILTNHHVVELAENGGAVTVIFNDGSRAKATIVGTDALTDSALIKAEGRTDLKPATLGKSDRLVVGQKVVAIGAPFGLNATVTSGIVSALDRAVNVSTDATGNATTYPAIQTDAAINPGNSGGPLTDMNGDVIGINSSIRTASDANSSAAGSIGLGFAIPIDELLPIVQQMRAGETPTHARLGISVGPTSADATTLGATVAQVTAGSTAAKAGLKQGDVITRLNDRLIDNPDTLIATIRSYRPGDKVTLTWERNGKSQSASLKLDSDEGKLASESSSGQNGQGQQGQGQGQGQQDQQDPFGGFGGFGQ